MSYIRQLVTIQFCITFVVSGENYHYRANSGFHRNKLSFEEKNFFWSNMIDGTNNAKNCFCPQNESHGCYPSFSGLLKHFCQKLTKKLIFRFMRDVRITRKGLFSSKESETGQILSKTFLNFKLATLGCS